jgi:hypothetical protein
MLLGVLLLGVPGVLGACTGSAGSGRHTSVGRPAPTSASPGVTASGTGGSTGSPARSGPTGPPPPSVPADVPTTGPNLLHPGETPPLMPLAATQHTQAGAVAFAKFFIQTIDWGYATTSSAYMKHYFGPGCRACNTFSSAISSARSKNERFEGGHLTIRSAQSRSLQPGDSAVTIDLLVDITTFARLNQHGVFLDGEPAQTGISFELETRWAHGGWFVEDLRAGA